MNNPIPERPDALGPRRQNSHDEDLSEVAGENSPSHGAFGLTQEEVDALQDIIRRETGEELTNEEAWARAIELIAMFRMLLGPLPEDSEESPLI